MNTFTAFVLGLIVGWVVEWIIDWIYWRGRRSAETTQTPAIAVTRFPQEADLKKSERTIADLEAQLSKQKLDNAALQEKLKALEARNLSMSTSAGTAPGMAAVSMPPASFGEINASPVPEPGVQSTEMADLPQPPADGPTNFENMDVSPVTEPAMRSSDVAIPQAIDSTPVKPDDLIVIKGIGPVIAGKLNNAGIYTFKQLAAITPAQLREIVGDVIQRLADEQDIINQAKNLAAGRDRSANS